MEVKNGVLYCESLERFLSEYFKVVRSSKDQWVYFNGVVDGNSIDIKSFNDWVQVLKINNYRTGFNMGCSKDQNTNSITSYYNDYTL